MTGFNAHRTATVARLGPELALIDSELGVAAAELREVARQLRERGQAPQPDAGTATPVRRAEARTTRPEPRRIPSRPTPTLRTRFATVAMCLACAVAIGASAFGAVPAAGPRQADQAGAHASASALRERAMRDARAARTYTWSAVPGARQYEVEILRGEQSVFEATTRKLAVELPVGLRMEAGRYTWLVTPTFGDGRSAMRPVVEATFLVAGSPS